jgi:hypothetical protein
MTVVNAACCLLFNWALYPRICVCKSKGVIDSLQGLASRRFDDAMPFQSVVSAALIIFSVLFRIWGLANSG